MVVIRSRQRAAIAQAVQAMYTDVALHPDRGFHFPTGRDCCRFVGYPEALIDAVPQEVIESFAGVACPFVGEPIAAGETVLDIGSGSGTDAWIAGRLAGAAGHVIGIDFTPAMLVKLGPAAGARTGCARAPSGERATLTLLHGDAEALPLADACVDVVTSNGVLNLVPDKLRAVGEIFRVVRPGGRIQVADVVLRQPVSQSCRADPRLWAECVVGATLEERLIGMLRAAGFHDVAVRCRLDYFAGSASPDTREITAALGAEAIVLEARR